MTGPVTSLHYAANGNFVNGAYAPGADGFNLADVSSASQLNTLPTGVKGLVWIGMTDGVTPAFTAAVNACIGNPNLYGFYLTDEPPGSATIAANLKAEADYIKANVPGAITYMTQQNLSSATNPMYYYSPANTHIGLFGIDPYPVQTNVPNNLDYNIIPAAVAASEQAGVPLADIVPVYQAFGGGIYPSYILPTAAQEQQILAIWASVVPNPAFDYAYSWGTQGGDTALSNDPALQAVFAAQNGIGGAAPSPVILSPALGSTDTTTTEPVISGTGVSGDTVTISIDGSVVGTTPVSNGAWNYALTSPLGNAAHTVTATQAAAGGPSSPPSAADTFTVNVSPLGLTIDSAVSAPLTLAASKNPLTITRAGSVVATASGVDAIDGASGTAWSITNAGTVSSSQRYGISLHSAGSSVVNSGSISGYSGSGGHGLDLQDGGSVTNTSTGSVSGGEDGIFVYGAPGTIDNSGQITSTFDDGLSLFGGGSVTNNAGGFIQAPTGGGYGPAGIYIPAGAASVVNHGSIGGQYGIYFGVAGTVENGGTISGTSYSVDFMTSNSANRLIVDPGAVFHGGVKGNGGVLELAAGTDTIGQIGSNAFRGFQTLSDDVNALWTLTGTNKIANVTDNGSVNIAGTLDVTGSVDAASTGQINLESGGSLEVAADTAVHSAIDFVSLGKLIIDNASRFGTGVGSSSYAGPLVENFVSGDNIDLRTFSPVAAALLYDSASGLLQMSNGSHQVATLDFQNSSLGTGSFNFTSDGHGGTLIRHS